MDQEDLYIINNQAPGDNSQPLGSSLKLEHNGGLQADAWMRRPVVDESVNFLLKIPVTFVKNGFNLANLKPLVPNYQDALNLLLGRLDNIERRTKQELCNLKDEADHLWIFIHSRYASTPSGIAETVNKYLQRKFGVCPRVGCGSSPVLPCATTDIPDVDSLKGYCPRCRDLYEIRTPELHTVDGTCYGTSLAHIIVNTCQGLEANLKFKSKPSHFWLLGMEYPCCGITKTSSGTKSDDNTVSIKGNSSTMETEEESNVQSMGSADLSSAYDEDNNSQGSSDSSSLTASCYAIYTPRIYSFAISLRCPYLKHRRWLRWRSPMCKESLYPSLFKNNPQANDPKTGSSLLTQLPQVLTSILGSFLIFSIF